LPHSVLREILKTSFAAALKGRHLPTLDGWRAVAIAMVLFCHARLPHDFLAPYSVYGALGVDLFFALSGFIITHRLLEEHRLTGSISLGAFYHRRVFRILPPILVFLAAISVLGLAYRIIPLDPKQILASAFFYRNYYSSPVTQSWYTGHFWSLSVEEHFYLLWPGLLVLALKWTSLRGSKWLAPTLALAVAAWRILDQHYQWIGALAPDLRGSPARTDYRLDGLLWGCALAFLWQNESLHKWFGTRTLLAAAAAMILLLWTQPPAHEAALAMLFPVFLASTLAQPASTISKLLSLAPIAWLGRISYSLYVWQQLFVPTRGLPMPLGAMQMFPLNIVLALVAATASYYLVEQPCLQWGKSLLHHRAQSASLAFYPVPKNVADSGQ
jgi:peptidoglycan/LPS O-acetylase OafA/YrhL